MKRECKLHGCIINSEVLDIERRERLTSTFESLDKILRQDGSTSSVTVRLKNDNASRRIRAYDQMCDDCPARSPQLR